MEVVSVDRTCRGASGSRVSLLAALVSNDAVGWLLSECGATAANVLRVKLGCHGASVIHSGPAVSRALQSLGMQSVLHKFATRPPGSTSQLLSFRDVYRELSACGATEEEILRVGVSLDHFNRRLSQLQQNL
jgi:hypothetical protein